MRFFPRKCSIDQPYLSANVPHKIFLMQYVKAITRIKLHDKSMLIKIDQHVHVYIQVNIHLTSCLKPFGRWITRH